MSGVILGDVLGRGGEGVVHALPQHPDYVAKVFHQAPEGEKREHIEHLIAHASPQLTKSAAWPLGIERLTDGRLALISPRVASAIEIHDFYGTETRLQHFPEATWADCVRVAEAVASIEEGVHKAGFIHADINEQNFLMDANGEPVLIDCESVMSTHNGRRTFGGPYREEWLPPELIGVDLGTIERTRNHDCFALALLLFRILMLGRHPFVGVPIEGATMPSDMDAVAGHHFVYVGMSDAMRPPDAAPPFTMLPPNLQGMFVQAFGPGGRHQRPTATEWRKALAKLSAKLSECRVVPERHAYSDHMDHCPWCALAPTFDAFPEVSVEPVPSSFPPVGEGNPDWSQPPRSALPRRRTLPLRSWVQMAGLSVGLLGAAWTMAIMVS